MSAPILLPRPYKATTITQRQSDGYMDASAMCRAHGKLWADYYRSNRTKQFLQALAESEGIPVSRAEAVMGNPITVTHEFPRSLIESQQGGVPGQQGTWIHPKVAIHLAQWLNPNFAVAVTNWVLELVTKGHVSLPVAGPHSRSASPMIDSAEHAQELEIVRDQQTKIAAVVMQLVALVQSVPVIAKEVHQQGRRLDQLTDIYENQGFSLANIEQHLSVLSNTRSDLERELKERNADELNYITARQIHRTRGWSLDKRDVQRTEQTLLSLSARHDIPTRPCREKGRWGVAYKLPEVLKYLDEETNLQSREIEE